jgi:tetratricopeptide (TPR) repeat protein
MMGRKLLLCAAVVLSIYGFFAPASTAWSQQPEGAIEATVFVDRGLVAYQDKKYDEALKEFQEAARLNPENIDALYYIGLAHVALGRMGDALAVLEKARTMSPDDFDVVFQLGALYFSQKEYDKAEPLLERVYQTEPTRPNIGYYLGFIEYRKKNYREALRYLRGNVPSDDDFAQLTRFYAGLTLSALGFAREARAEVEDALRLQPVSPLTAPAQRFGEILERAAQREKFFRGELRLGLFYDTNVPVIPNRSADDTVTTIREGNRRQRSEGQLASVNLAYKFLKTPDWEGDASYRLLQTYVDHLPRFNTQSHTPTIGINTRGTMPSAFGDLAYVLGLQTTYDFIMLGNRRFTERWIVNPYWTLVENPNNLTTVQYRLQVKNFFRDNDLANREVRDAINHMIGPLHYLLFENGKHYIKLGYQYDSEDAEGENWIYWGNRLLFGIQYTLPWQEIRFRYDLDGHWRYHRFKHSQLPTYATSTVKRKDREQTHLLGFAMDFWTNFTVALEYLFAKNKSNIASFDYVRHVVTTSLTWRFDASIFAL